MSISFNPFIRYVNGYVLAAIMAFSTVSVSADSYQGTTNSYYYVNSNDEYSDCCPCNNGCVNKKGAAITAGAVALGAVIGVVAGGACSRKHHHSSPGPRGCRGTSGEQGPQGGIGPFGPGPFKPLPNPNETLTFTLTNTTNTFEAGTTTVILPFVVTPDGRTLLGTPETFTGPGTFPVSFQIIVDRLVFGTYNFGLKINIVGGTGLSTLFDPINVLATINSLATDISDNRNFIINSSLLELIYLYSLLEE